MSQEHNHKMIEAFIGKPDKTLWYEMSFQKYNLHGVDAMKWNWSWWGFAGGFLFLLYRKQYLPALGVFIASMTLGMIPFVGLIIAILVGGYGTFFVYKGYKKKLHEIQSNIEDESLQIQTMREVGGYHQWVVWLYALFIGVIFSGIFFAILIPSYM